MNEQPDFWKEEEEPEDDGKLPPDHWRKCNHCREEYFCRVRRSRPTYIPMHCERCAESAAEDLKRRTAIWRERMLRGELRWKAKPLTGDKPWEKAPAPGTEFAPKRAKRARRKPSSEPEAGHPAPEPSQPDAAMLGAASFLAGMGPGGGAKKS